MIQGIKNTDGKSARSGFVAFAMFTIGLTGKWPPPKDDPA
jgi:hypothetical protein